MKKILTVWALIILLLGCKVTKDNRAYTRVISDPALAEKTYRALEVTHPCINTIYVGKDSIIVDTIQDLQGVINANQIIDSLLSRILNRTDTAYIDIDSITNEIYAEARKQLKPVYVTITKVRIDTIIDNRQEVIYHNDNMVLTGKNTELTAQVASLKKTNNRRLYLIIGEGLLLLASIFVYIKKK